MQHLRSSADPSHSVLRFKGNAVLGGVNMDIKEIIEGVIGWASLFGIVFMLSVVGG